MVLKMSIVSTLPDERSYILEARKGAIYFTNQVSDDKMENILRSASSISSAKKLPSMYILFFPFSKRHVFFQIFVRSLVGLLKMFIKLGYNLNRAPRFLRRMSGSRFRHRIR